MISNTSCPGLKLVDKVGLEPDVDQREIKFISTQPSNSNNNNIDISNNKNMSLAKTNLQIKASKPFIFYTSGVDGVLPQTNERPTIVFQTSFNHDLLTKTRSTVCESEIKCEPGEKGTANIFISVPNHSALNGGEDANEGNPMPVTSPTQKISGDTSSSCSSSHSNKSENMLSQSDRQKSPMCRTEDQENAFRQIEVVHNYSKLNRLDNGSISHTANVAMYSSNSSNLDEDEDDDEVDDYDEDCDYLEHMKSKFEGTVSAMERESETMTKSFSSVSPIKTEDLQENQCLGLPAECLKVIIKQEDDGNKVPPDHYARRPMNAFLIFCKRHRAIVKDKYKNLENRSITKILGEWWASLDPKDKKCYVDLAKQNKDAFFSANPHFKWYKLPAPPRRTLNTRPGNIDRPYFGQDEYQSEYKDSPENCQDYYSNTSITNCSRNGSKKVSFFKLADETQMGELNNLMRPTATASSFDALQEALGRTSDSISTGRKRSSNSSFDEFSINKRSNSDISRSSSEDDLMPKKSARSCKGKKYQELMNSGQFAVITAKKQVLIKPSGAVVDNTNSQKMLMHGVRIKNELSTIDSDLFAKKKGAQDIEEQFLLSNFSDSHESPCKQQHYGCISFDLEDKIKALPAQCLETYLQRKKNTKRKKKINPKKRYPPQSKSEAATLRAVSKSQSRSPKTAQEAKEQMVGSQKRKARKESITRRDINSIQNEVQVMFSNGSINTLAVGSNINPVPQSLIAVNQNTNSDLLILAEVAANHTGSVQ